LRRDVRRIGLQHQGPGRQLARERANLQRALEGHRAAEAQSEAARHEGRRLLRAAVEGVRDAARHLDAAQPRQQRVGRAPHVQDHGQPGVACQAQLREVEALLQRAVEPGHEVVEPDLAHGHQARIVALRLQRGAQPFEVAVLRPRHVQGVDAERVDAVVRMRQRAHGLEVGALDGRQHEGAHAGRTRPLHHAGAVGVELGGVEMAMGIDPHRAAIMYQPPPALARAPRRAPGRPRWARACGSRRDVIPCAREHPA
jgi:hypothetical protein